jgi:hypothetical protein
MALAQQTHLHLIGFGRFWRVEAMGTGAAGYYPGDRQFGSIVQRSLLLRNGTWIVTG